MKSTSASETMKANQISWGRRRNIVFVFFRETAGEDAKKSSATQLLLLIEIDLTNASNNVTQNLEEGFRESLFPPIKLGHCCNFQWIDKIMATLGFDRRFVLIETNLSLKVPLFTHIRSLRASLWRKFYELPSTGNHKSDDLFNTQKIGKATCM